MKQTRIFLLLAVLIFAAASLRHGANAAAASAAHSQQSQQSSPTIASAMDREISAI
jgi:hypothetical protein